MPPLFAAEEATAKNSQLQGQGQEELPFDPRHAPGFGGAHSDSAVLDDRPIHAMNRIRLRATCYIGDVPEGAGGLVSYILDLPRFPVLANLESVVMPER